MSRHSFRCFCLSSQGLAYLRTSLSLVSLGIGVAQLFQIPDLVRSRSADDDGHDGSEGGEVALLRFMRRLADDDGARRAGINLGKPIGALCILLGGLCLLFGARRYFVVQRALVRGRFEPSRIEVSALSLGAGALIVCSFGVIVGARLGSSSG
ncbi:hypothetical protein FA09DRAFT_179222 [Tilletiopsis washingtonensis]|uniref:DUF202 domain-containing protein n=1 Tax=Tilletiopsis washingtonensis TaxID=58919 RepID=A0A316YYN3_9BASI|nr:hypothetical protein FA09DRAFT_179222 [Tilletiopsis washingtonensis]PWN94590.1 hypothetical protein FA09DRAFT_179222 [Tilletiopsis washingtonensis]